MGGINSNQNGMAGSGPAGSGSNPYQQWQNRRQDFASRPANIQNMQGMPQPGAYQPQQQDINMANNARQEANYQAGSAKRGMQDWMANNPQMSQGNINARMTGAQKQAQNAMNRGAGPMNGGLQGRMDAFDARQAGPQPGSVEHYRESQGFDSSNAQMGENEARRRGYIEGEYVAPERPSTAANNPNAGGLAGAGQRQAARAAAPPRQGRRAQRAGRRDNQDLTGQLAPEGDMLAPGEAPMSTVDPAPQQRSRGDSFQNQRTTAGMLRGRGPQRQFTPRGPAPKRRAPGDLTGQLAPEGNMLAPSDR